jgi:AraC family transcriptional regulator
MGAREPDYYFRDKTLRPGQGHDRLAHDHDVVTLVLAGRLDEVFPEGTQRCARWELHYKPRRAVHATTTGPAGVRMFLLGLRGEFVEGLDLPNAPQVVGGGAPAARALGAFVELAESQRRTGSVDRAAIRRLAECVQPQPESPASRRPTWITEVHDRILTEHVGRTSLSRLAGEFRVHSVYLARAFRKHYGRSIGSLRRQVRVTRAIDRLAGGARSLIDVAHELDYADQSHFTREFRTETGWSPGRFRATVVALDGGSTV